MTYPSSAWRMWMCSSTRMTLTWSRFFVVQRITLPSGSTSLSSKIQDSALDIMPFGAHLGSEPVLRMRRVVRRVPAGVTSREMTSQERMCDAKGFGYLKRYARETMDQGSLQGRVLVLCGSAGRSDAPTHSYKKDCE